MPFLPCTGRKNRAARCSPGPPTIGHDRLGRCMKTVETYQVVLSITVDSTWPASVQAPAFTHGVGDKSVYEYIVYDSEVEREFARCLDQREDIKLFVKLPGWFEIDTPVGKYNPDWAILKQDDQTLYLVRETKATRDFLQLRTSEADKVRCGQRHFEALGVPFAVAVSVDEV